MKKINLNTCWSLKILGDNVYHIPENEIPAKVPGSVYSTLLDNGLMPDPTNLPEGCKFYDRCPYACEKCKEKEPEMREYRPGHFVRCIRQGGEK